MQHLTTGMEPITLFSILIGIIVLSKIIAHGIRVVDVLIYIILGFLFASSGYLDVQSKEIVKFLSEIGVLFLMFYAGWHEDSKTFVKKIIENKWVAIIGAIGPFIGAYLAVVLLGFTFNEGIVAGFIFTATAVPYTVAVLQSLKLDKTPAAKSIIAAAMADDFISIITMSAVFTTFVAFQTGDKPDLISIAFSTGLSLLYLVLCFLVFILLSKYIFPYHSYNYKEYKGIRKALLFTRQIFGLKWFTMKFHKVEILIPTVIFIILFLSFFAHLMGLHAAIGAYLTGLILNNDMFHHGDEHDRHIDLTGVMYSLANHFLGPIFFIYLGTELVIDFSSFGDIFFYSFVIFIFVAIFQFISASFAAKYTANLGVKDSILVGLGMMPRDVLAFVILGIAISSGLVEAESFTTIIIVSIILLDIFTPLAIKCFVKNYYNK